jgi:hypothetical protein
MEITKGSKDYGKDICKLNKAIYGLRQSGRLWNFKINEVLIELDFVRCKSEPCIYYLKE